MSWRDQELASILGGNPLKADPLGRGLKLNYCIMKKWVNEWNEYDEYFNNCNEWIIAMNERGEGMHEWNDCMNAWI